MEESKSFRQETFNLSQYFSKKTPTGVNQTFKVNTTTKSLVNMKNVLKTLNSSKNGLET